MELRQYQREAIEALPESGAFLIHLATGLGKTVTMSRIPRRGRLLILSHREELVNQPRKYFDCSYGVVMSGKNESGAEVVSASVQTMAKRLNEYAPDAFDLIVVDEAHHAASKTYRAILGHFKPRLLVGITATPNRTDRGRLDDIFERIVYSRNLRWGISEGYLSPIDCRRVKMSFDLSRCKIKGGDYDLSTELDGTAEEVAEAYKAHGVGATLIFASSVQHAENISRLIDRSMVITGETRNRSEIIERFCRREVKCLINCMVFTEGTDIPLIETVIIARPTRNEGLYAQMVGRGLRLSEGKQFLRLIDCVGVSDMPLCTAPSLYGYDLEAIPLSKRAQLEGDLDDLADLIPKLSDNVEGWLLNDKQIDVWSKRMGYNTHDINFTRRPDGSLLIMDLVIPPEDSLGMVFGKPMQEVLDAVLVSLRRDHADKMPLWRRSSRKRWGREAATPAQTRIIKGRTGYAEPLTKGQASIILSHLLKK